MTEDEKVSLNTASESKANDENTPHQTTHDNKTQLVNNESNNHQLSVEETKNLLIGSFDLVSTPEHNDANPTQMDIDATAFDIEEQPLITEDQSTNEIKIDTNGNSGNSGGSTSKQQQQQIDEARVVLNNSIAGSSLSLLAEYDSSSEDSLDDSSSDDDDEDDDSESESTDSNDAGTGVESSGLEIPDIPSASSDSSDSNSDASSEKSMTAIKKKIDEIEPVGEDDEELLLDDEDDRRPPPRLKVPGELGIDDLPPIEDLHITVAEDKCELLGKISSIVEQLVLVESIPNKVPFDLDTVLFLDKGRTPLGKIFDVMGPVHCPIYCIRFNSHQDILDRNIVVGLSVYCAPSAPCSQLVILSMLTKMKGSDASWQDDIEPPERYIEYSDDEQERAARKARKNKTNGVQQSEIGENCSSGEMRQPRGPPRPMARGRRQNHQQPPHHQPQYGPGNGYGGYGRRNPNFRPQTPPQQYPPQYFRLPPMYQNSYANAGQFFVNPFAFTPQVNYPPFNPALFGGPPPPPPPPPSNNRR